MRYNTAKNKAYDCPLFPNFLIFVPLEVQRMQRVVFLQIAAPFFGQQR
jgi:hypothetical protein